MKFIMLMTIVHKNVRVSSSRSIVVWSPLGLAT